MLSRCTYSGKETRACAARDAPTRNRRKPLAQELWGADEEGKPTLMGSCDVAVITYEALMSDLRGAREEAGYIISRLKYALRISGRSRNMMGCLSFCGLHQEDLHTGSPSQCLDCSHCSNFRLKARKHRIEVWHKTRGTLSNKGSKHFAFLRMHAFKNAQAQASSG